MSYSLAFSQALLAMVFIADKVQLGMFEFISNREISESLNIPAPTVSKFLRALSANGIIETREGAKGGVRLAILPEELKLWDIFIAIEHQQPLFKANWEVRVKGTKPTRAQAAILNILDDAQSAMEAKLKEVSLSEILEDINQ